MEKYGNTITHWILIVSVAVLFWELIASASSCVREQTSSLQKQMELNNAAYIECIKTIQKPLECRDSVYVTR